MPLQIKLKFLGKDSMPYDKQCLDFLKLYTVPAAFNLSEELGLHSSAVLQYLRILTKLYVQDIVLNELRVPEVIFANLDAYLHHWM